MNWDLQLACWMLVDLVQRRVIAAFCVQRDAVGRPLFALDNKR